jgi:hypothetical protein
VSSDSIATTNSKTYSGYAVAESSDSPPSYTVDFASAQWVVPVPSKDSGSGQPTCPNTGLYCRIDAWVGIQNSTYDGPDHTPSGTGQVFQAGTQSQLVCSPSCLASYDAWALYLKAGRSHTYDPLDCGVSYWTPSAGDTMNVEVGSELEINGSSGIYFYAIIRDSAQSRACFSGTQYTTSEVSSTNYYSDFFAERPQVGSSYYSLPRFQQINFTDAMMGSEGTKSGAYPNYNNGYGFGSYMYNLATNTATSSMSEVLGTDGAFTVTYESGVDTCAPGGTSAC